MIPRGCEPAKVTACRAATQDDARHATNLAAHSYEAAALRLVADDTHGTDQTSTEWATAKRADLVTDELLYATITSVRRTIR